MQAKPLRKTLSLCIAAAALTLGMSASSAFAAEAPMIHVGEDTVTLPRQLSPLEQKAFYALVYGYPKVYFETLYEIRTNVEAPIADPNHLRAPPNQFVHNGSQMTRDNKNGMAPNSDTLYSEAFFDVSKEPMVWHMPAWEGHYYVCPLHNTVADNISLGSRTNGGHGIDYLITGPNWIGRVPKGLQRVSVDSDHLWTVCRIEQDYDEASVAAAQSFQHGLHIVPLSAWEKEKATGEKYVAPKGIVNPEAEPQMGRPMFKVIADRGVVNFFERLVADMKVQPPSTDDVEAVAILKEFGVEEGKPFDWSSLSAGKQAALTAVWPLLQPTLHSSLASIAAQGAQNNGWPNAINVGRYGMHYLGRATAAEFGFSGNMKEDNMQGINARDAEGQPLNGEHNYVIHFAPGKTPPVDGFWSYTTYEKGTWNIALPEGRNPIGNHDKTNPLYFNADGSVDILLQAHEPTDENMKHNWLPTPAGKDFVVYFRSYGPHPDMYVMNSANWQPKWTQAKIQRVDSTVAQARN